MCKTCDMALLALFVKIMRIKMQKLLKRAVTVFLDVLHHRMRSQIAAVHA